MLASRTAFATLPHAVFHRVFGESTVAALLDYVAKRQVDFKPALIRNRNTGERRVDYGQRSSLALADLGPFKAPIEEFARRISPPALAQMNLPASDLEPKDFEITCFRDGNHFGAHIDTDERMSRVRVLSCVYYFSQTPRRFDGGTLRLYGLPTLSLGAAPGFIDIVPETDTMAVFPSWLRHEVLPVKVPSGAWMDGRFTINCWLHRPAPTTSETPRSA
jgi:hypothetical protein